MKIKIQYLEKNLKKIEKREEGDWIDLRAAKQVEMKAGEFYLIPLGISMKLPEGYEAHLVPRSSTFQNFGILQTNGMGIIDSSYCGAEDSWFFPAYATRDTKIEENDRICQFRIMKIQPEIELVEVEELKEKKRGGFGSTGIH